MKIFLVAISFVICASGLFISCSKSSDANCPNCGKPFDGKTKVQCVMSNGEEVVICQPCYAVFYTAGKCLQGKVVK